MNHDHSSVVMVGLTFNLARQYLQSCLHLLLSKLFYSADYRGEAIPGEDSLMHDMPQSVRENVGTEECSSLLNNFPVFKRQVSLAMSTYVFAPGDIVLCHGDMGDVLCAEGLCGGEELPLGLLPSQLRSMVSLSTKVRFVMLLHFDTTGNPSHLPLHVDVVPNFQSSMSSLVQRVAFPLSGIIKSV